MTCNRFGLYRFGLYGAVTAAGLTICLILSACGAQQGRNEAAESVPPSQVAVATSEPSGRASATPTPTAASTTVAPSPPSPVQSVVPAAPIQPAPKAPAAVVPSTEAPARQVVPVKPVQPALKSFTFPDGHISFSYPASWSVTTQRGPGRDGPPWQPVEAIVSDESGGDLYSVSSGADGIGCTAGPVNRTVFDSAAVPGMREVDGTTPMFAFIAENAGDREWYVMAVMNPRNLQEGDVGSSCTLLSMENGGAQNRVIFKQPAFPTRQAAKAWMATKQYAQLKALIMSLNYS